MLPGTLKEESRILKLRICAPKRIAPILIFKMSRICHDFTRGGRRSHTRRERGSKEHADLNCGSAMQLAIARLAQLPLQPVVLPGANTAVTFARAGLCDSCDHNYVFCFGDC